MREANSIRSFGAVEPDPTPGGVAAGAATGVEAASAGAVTVSTGARPEAQRAKRSSAGTPIARRRATANRLIDRCTREFYPGALLLQ